MLLHLRTWLGISLMAMATAGLAALPATAKEKKPGKQKKAESAAQAKTETTTEQGKTHTVARGPFKQEIVLDATVAAIHTTEIFVDPEEWSQLTIRKVVPHGTRVTKGQTLVKFDSTKLSQQIRDLEAAQALTELNLQQAHREAELLAKSMPLDTELAAQNKLQADENLARFEKIDRDFSEKSSAQQVKQFQNFQEYVEEELKQLEKMYKADDLTEETEEIVLKRARNEVEQIKFLVEMAKHGRDRQLGVELPRSLTTYRHAAAQAGVLLEKARVTLPLLIEKQKLEVEKLKFEQKKAAEQIEQMKGDLQKLTVTSPADGLVFYGHWQGGKWTGTTESLQKIRPGGQIQPHEFLLTVVQTDALEIEAVLPEKDLAHVTPGTAGNLIHKAWPDRKIAVKVREVTAAPQNDGQFATTLSLEGSSPIPLVPGMTGQVKIVAYFKADAIAVPAKAVFHDEADDDKRYVLVPEKDGPPQRRDVTVAHSTDTTAEISAGLSPGDKILLEKPNE